MRGGPIPRSSGRTARADAPPTFTCNGRRAEPAQPRQSTAGAVLVTAGRARLSSGGQPCDESARMDPSQVPETAGQRGPTLSTWQKVAYGFGDLALAVRQTVFQFAMLPFFTDVVLLAPWLAGAAKMVGLVWDGVNDPITGYLSDGTRSRLGRRRPYMLAAALPMGLTFALLWLV